VKLIGMGLCGLFVLLSVLVFPGMAWEEDLGTLSVSAAMERIKSKGVSKALETFYENKKDWQAFLAGVGSGDEKWLNVAIQLKGATDAGTSEQLDLAVGEALEHSPANVFKIAFPVFIIEMVCAGPDIDDERYSSYDLAMGAIKKRIRMVETITVPTLQSSKLRCVQHLEASKDGIAHFYGNKK
jgi:hypothetical protein